MTDKELLQAYEDTGLEPEDVEQLYSPNRDIVKLVVGNRELNSKYGTLLEMYDELQNKLKSIDGWNTALEEQFEKDGEELKKYKDTGLEPEEVKKYFDDHVKEINRLRDIVTKYDVLKHQERLVILPCKVGDTIYAAEKIHNKIYEIRVKSFEVALANDLYILGVADGRGLKYIPASYFDKDILFLTREEAEKALEVKK